MGKTSLIRRVSSLEKQIQGGREHYVQCMHAPLSVNYDVVTGAMMLQEDIATSVGPFRSFREARGWSLKDLQQKYPLAYERMVKEHGLDRLMSEKWLHIDLLVDMPEYVQEHDRQAMEAAERQSSIIAGGVSSESTSPRTT